MRRTVGADQSGAIEVLYDPQAPQGEALRVRSIADVPDDIKDLLRDYPEARG